MVKLGQEFMQVIWSRIMTDRPVSVSIIIVSWNCSGYICDCLQSINDYTRNNTFEIIVIDNGSSDGTPDLIRNMFPGVRLVEAGANLGFARATNSGVRLSQGEYVFFLNPDTLIKSDVVGELVHFLETHPDGGAAGPKMLGRDNSITLLNVRELPSISGAVFTQFGLRMLFPNSALFAHESMPGWDRQSDRDVPFMSGAALMFPRPVLQEIGLLDEQIPMYFEDLDICTRVRESGKEIYYVSSASLQHLEGMCSELSPVRSLLYAMENGHAQWLFFKKYRGTASAAIFVVVIVLGSIARLALFGALHCYTCIVRKESSGPLRLKIAKSRSLLDWSLSSKKNFREKVAQYFAIETGGDARIPSIREASL
jgi:N-acetylglucosaminyl-diphospho-decaprenol L-rhamnosyltransferase